MDALPLDVLDGIGFLAVAAIVFWMIATGRLVTRREHDLTVHDRDEWRAESRIKDAQLSEKDKQLEHMEQVGRTVEQFTRGLQQEMRDR